LPSLARQRGHSSDVVDTIGLYTVSLQVGQLRYAISPQAAGEVKVAQTGGSVNQIGMTYSEAMELDAEIDRLYGLPLDEFVRGRDELARRLGREGHRDEAALVKALRKPTVGAWALNQAVRRRRVETDALLATGRRLRAAHEDLMSGGDPAVLRETMEEERSLTTALADCAEAIASETGKSGPALRDRVRATLHAAVVEDEVREELAAGRFVREREAVGLGLVEPPSGSTTAPAKRPAASPRKERGAPTGPARAPAKGASSVGTRRRAEAAPDPRLTEAERALAEAREALASAEADHAATLSGAESARAALQEAEEAEREARRSVRELWREVAKQERRVERLRPKP
jgi:hypothetical protein